MNAMILDDVGVNASICPISYRIALVDNDPRALSSLCELIHTRLSPSRVIWMTSRGDEAIERCLNGRSKPDLLVVDMSLEGIQGTSVCRRIRAHAPKPAILGITSFSMRRYRQKVSDCGAQGIVGKSSEDEILDGIARVAAGATFSGFDTAQMAHMRLKYDHTVKLLLTVREEEVITLSAEQGLSNQEIAEELNITQATVRKHMQHIVCKLGAKSTRHAGAMWLSQAE